ncbi:MAG TPA: DNA topoisomerase IV subunit A [Planctomycetaceae bacterium]|nr:DNA topoisomerase IV subunit A [Planctomycetaceae bacterium]
MAPPDTTTSTAENGDRILYVPLSQETRRRYLNYALSVITSRALPDVRDGLKPVQRRILYVMYNDLRLHPDAKTRKCSKICGDTTGNYHPHGQSSVYDTLVRMAQDFSLRYPLVDGQGNFGSVIGLSPAAERYTEARLSAVSEELMSELRFQTVDMRPNYDATREEPIVLPARFPNLLVNGSSGIAVGMATNIPPHNLGEVVRAAVYLIDSDDATVAQLMKFIKGPDFPLGGRIVTDRRELRLAYEEGRGAIKVRATWKFDKKGRNSLENRMIIDSIPFGVETGPLLASIGEIIASRKLPQLLNVADESDESSGLRIVLEIKSASDAEAVIAFLYKRTALEQNFAMNLTSLVPDDQGLPVPARLSLVEMLRYFLDFRLVTVRRRFEYQLEQIRKRIHILEGFEIIFNGLDKALKIIRGSQGKQDAAEKLMREFPLDEVQTNAILEIQLYRISQLEIDKIIEELKEKRAEAERIEKILSSESRLWKVVKTELLEVADKFPEKRRTEIGTSEDIQEFDPQAYIVKENTNVVVTTDGWIKRVGRLASVEGTRVREGDNVLDVLPASTLDTVVLFSSAGIAYTLSVTEIPASSGYGDPISKYVKLDDGEKIVGAVSTDSRFTPEDKTPGDPTSEPFVMVVTALGQVLAMSLSAYRTASTKAGRKYCRLRKGDSVMFARLIRDHESVFLATKNARIVHFALSEVPVLNNAGIGVKGIKLEKGDEVLGAAMMARPSDSLKIMNSNDTLITIGQQKYNITSRGGKGIKTSQRNDFVEIQRPEIELIDWNAIEADAE